MHKPYVHRTLGKTLSRRQKEVLRFLAYGLSCKETAEELGLTQRTVESHKTTLMKKLVIHHRVDLVRAALIIGAIDFDEWIGDLDLAKRIYSQAEGEPANEPA